MVGREESSGIHIGITAFATPQRLGTLLRALPRDVAPITVFEDPSTEETHEVFVDVCEQHRVPLRLKPEWGGMQGIIQYAVEQTPCEWFIYVPDDVLPTPGALEWLVRWIEILPKSVGLIQMPYWNYEDLNLGGDRWSMFHRPDLDWLRSVPLNPHWWGPALYINVNGAGFALRRELWERIGGWDLRTWCLDEYIAYRMWTQTDYVCVSVPGPAWVHGGGLSTPAQHALGHAHLRAATLDGWIDATGKDKDICANEIRASMAKRSFEVGLVCR